MAANHTIRSLVLKCTDLIGPDNVGKWGEALMANTTITTLLMKKGAEMEALEKQTEGRTHELTINRFL